MSGDNPFDTSGGGTRGGAASQTFRVTNPRAGLSTWLDDIEGRSTSRQAELFGGSPGAQRYYELENRYDVWSQAPGILGTPEPDDRGILVRLADWALRPSSAAVGFTTGLLGLDRYAHDKDLLGNQVGSDRIGAAYSRARQGLRGDTWYQFKDFTHIARKKAEGQEIAPYENTLNAVGGFIGDTAVDPLTYVSFGGNLYGRRMGARYVMGRVEMIADDIIANPGFDPYRFLAQTYDAGRASAITPAAIGSKMDVLRQQALAKQLITKPEDRAFLAAANFSPTSTMDEMLDLVRRVSTDEVDFARELARAFLPDAAGMQYWTGSARGLRKWLIRTMGMEDGMRFYKELPYDIQGGLRIRTPFVRGADGLPVTTKPVGGGGQVSEALAAKGFNQMEKFFDLTERGRDIARKFFFTTPGVRRFFIAGEFSEVAYDAIVGATGKIVSDGRTPFVAYRQFEQLKYRNVLEATTFNTQQTALRLAASEEFANAIKGLSIEDAREVNRHAFLYLSDRELLKEHIANPALAQGLQAKAIQTARMTEILLDSFGEQIELLGIDEKLLKNFAMRQKTLRQKAREKMASDMFTPSSGGKAGTFKFDRDSHVFEWKYDLNEGAKVARWKIAPDIQVFVDGQWENPYISDFITALFTYADDVTRTLDSWRLAKMAMESGMFTRGQTEEVLRYAQSLIERDINELIGQPGTPGSLRAIQRQIIDDFFEGDVSRYRDREMRQADIIRGMDNNALKSRAYALKLKEMDVTGVETRAYYDEFIEIFEPPAKKDVDKWWSSQSADSTIELTNTGKYRLVDNSGEVLSVHPTLEQAIVNASDRFMLARDGKFNNVMAAKLFEFIENIDDLMFMNIGQLGLPDDLRNLGTRIRGYDQQAQLDIHFGLWKYTEELSGLEKELAQETIVRRAYELIRYFGKEQVELDFSRSGQIVQEGRLRAFLNKEVKEDFRNWLENEAWADLTNVMYDSTGALNTRAQRVVQNRILERMEVVWAPRAMMDAYTNMVKVTANPDSLFDAVYNPLYTALRSSLTVWRGPGFVGRNLLGGSYNGMLYGVSKQDYLDSAQVLMARWRTRQIMLDKYGDRAYRDDTLVQEMLDTMQAQLNERFKNRTGTFIAGKRDADALMEIWELSYNADLVGGARTSRFIGETLLHAPFETPRSTAFDIRRPMDRYGVLEDYVDLESAIGRPLTRGSEETKRKLRAGYSKYAKAMQWVATENRWISRVMGPMASTSEDYMRFAAFLRGVQDFGLEPVESGVRGFSASTMVKLTQFDYSDLTAWEMRVFKNIMPFWVWTRNNVPLQVRSFIHDPGKIARYNRGVDMFQQFFQEDHKQPPPVYAENQFSVYIDPAYWDGAPKVLTPIVPKGTVAFNPFPWLDPVIDMNRWFRLPNRANPSPVSWPELANNINPIITSISSFIGDMQSRTDYAGRSDREAPKWAIELTPFLTKPDPNDPSITLMNSRVRNFVTTLAPQLNLFERYFPYFFGDQRQSDRWLTTMISAITGIGIMTIDDAQFAGETQSQIERNKHYIDRKFGPSAGFRMEMIRQLLDEGAPLWFIEAIDVANLPENHIDVARALRAWQIYQQTVAGLEGLQGEARDRYIETVLRTYGIQGPLPYSDDEANRYFSRGVFSHILESNFKGDFEQRIRAGRFHPPSNIELETIGVTRWEIDRLFARFKNEELSQDERDRAYSDLVEIYDAIVLGRQSGEFTIFGEKVRNPREDAMYGELWGK